MQRDSRRCVSTATAADWTATTHLSAAFCFCVTISPLLDTPTPLPFRFSFFCTTPQLCRPSMRASTVQELCLDSLYISYLNTELFICDVLHLGINIKKENEKEKMKKADRVGRVRVGKGGGGGSGAFERGSCQGSEQGLMAWCQPCCFIYCECLQFYFYFIFFLFCNFCILCSSLTPT